MAEVFEQKIQGLSAEEKLRAIDRYLTDLRGVLASMDEIAALRKRRGETDSGDFGGYKRADVIEWIADLEKQRREALEELSQPSEPGANVAGQAQGSAKERATITLALEKLHASLSAEIEHVRNDILRELKYSYKQSTAAYEELCARMDLLAEQVAQKIIEQALDYDLLAQRIVAQMASRSETEASAAMERRIEELEKILLSLRAQNLIRTPEETETPQGEALESDAQTPGEPTEEEWPEALPEETETPEGEALESDAQAPGEPTEEEWPEALPEETETPEGETLESDAQAPIETVVFAETAVEDFAEEKADAATDGAIATDFEQPPEPLPGHGPKAGAEESTAETNRSDEATCDAGEKRED